jgi:carbon storage regulator
MLILARKIGETIMIGDDVEVVVLGIKGNQIRVGVKASMDIKVYRKEIYRRIQEEKQTHEKINNINDKYT